MTRSCSLFFILLVVVCSASSFNRPHSVSDAVGVVIPEFAGLLKKMHAMQMSGAASRYPPSPARVLQGGSSCPSADSVLVTIITLEECKAALPFLEQLGNQVTSLSFDNSFLDQMCAMAPLCGTAIKNTLDRFITDRSANDPNCLILKGLGVISNTLCQRSSLDGSFCLAKWSFLANVTDEISFEQPVQAPLLDQLCKDNCIRVLMKELYGMIASSTSGVVPSTGATFDGVSLSDMLTLFCLKDENDNYCTVQFSKEASMIESGTYNPYAASGVDYVCSKCGRSMIGLASNIGVIPRSETEMLKKVVSAGCGSVNGTRCYEFTADPSLSQTFAEIDQNCPDLGSPTWNNCSPTCATTFKRAIRQFGCCLIPLYTVGSAVHEEDIDLSQIRSILKSINAECGLTGNAALKPMCTSATRSEKLGVVMRNVRFSYLASNATLKTRFVNAFVEDVAANMGLPLTAIFDVEVLPASPLFAVGGMRRLQSDVPVKVAFSVQADNDEDTVQAASTFNALLNEGTLSYTTIEKANILQVEAFINPVDGLDVSGASDPVPNGGGSGAVGLFGSSIIMALLVLVTLLST